MTAVLTPEQFEILTILTSTPTEPLCPNCGHRRQDPRSVNGWCVLCDARRERELESKRKWWRNNRGAEANRDGGW